MTVLEVGAGLGLLALEAAQAGADSALVCVGSDDLLLPARGISASNACGVTAPSEAGSRRSSQGAQEHDDDDGGEVEEYFAERGVDARGKPKAHSSRGAESMGRGTSRQRGEKLGARIASRSDVCRVRVETAETCRNKHLFGVSADQQQGADEVDSASSQPKAREGKSDEGPTRGRGEGPCAGGGGDVLILDISGGFGLPPRAPLEATPLADGICLFFG